MTTFATHSVSCLAALILFASLGQAAQDRIRMKNGTVQEVTIIRFDGQGDNRVVQVRLANGGQASYPMSLVESYRLAERPEAAEGIQALQANQLDRAIALLSPLVDAFMGAEANWVISAAGNLAEAYSLSGKPLESNALYRRIAEAYPDSIYRLKAKIGEAKDLVRRGLPDQAMKLLDEVEASVMDGRPKMPIPDPELMLMLGDIALVRAEAFEEKKDWASALEQYLRVVTIYHTPPSRASRARELADNLKKAHPGLVVR